MKEKEKVRLDFWTRGDKLALDALPLLSEPIGRTISVKFICQNQSTCGTQVGGHPHTNRTNIHNFTQQLQKMHLECKKSKSDRQPWREY
jgi:hypothetical protein